MPPVDLIAAPEEGYATLREKVEQVEDLVTPPKSVEEKPPRPGSAKLGTPERRLEWHQRVQAAVLDLSITFPEGVEDYDVRKLLEYTLELGRLIEADEEAGDPSGEVELATMRAADVVRRIQRRLLRQHLDDPAAALEFIFGLFANVSVSEVARLLGVSTKTVASWKGGNPVRQTEKRRRAVLLAQVITYLRDSMTPHGIVMWFDAERDQLGGRTPLEVLQRDSNAAELLISLARGSRGQLAG